MHENCRKNNNKQRSDAGRTSKEGTFKQRMRIVERTKEQEIQKAQEKKQQAEETRERSEIKRKTKTHDAVPDLNHIMPLCLHLRDKNKEITILAKKMVFRIFLV